MAAVDWAIVVGITSYPNLGPNTKPLQGPHLDAQAFRDWLVDPAGGGVPPDNIRLILWPPGSDTEKMGSVHAEIRGAVDELRRLANRKAQQGEGKHIGRRLYVYMSGHGFSPRSEETETVLLMPNADVVQCVGPSFHWPGVYTANFFYKQACFDEVLLFMDCCRTQVSLPSLDEPWNFQDDLVLYPNVKAFYAFAAKRGLAAYEQEDAAGNKRGAFTMALLAGLRGGAPESPSDDRITTESLRRYLYSTLAAPGPEFTKIDPIELSRAQKTYPVTIHLPPNTGDRQVQVCDQRLTIIESAAAALPGWQLSLKPGYYEARIQELGPGQLFEVQGTGAVDVHL